MTAALTLNDRLSRIVHELGEINKTMRPELSASEQLALLRQEHEAAGSVLTALEQQERAKRWEGKRWARSDARGKVRGAQRPGAAGVRAADLRRGRDVN